MEKHTAYIGVRIPKKLKELIKKVVSLDTHLNEADFIRDAIREKIERDAPQLYKRLFEREVSNDDD